MAQKEATCFFVVIHMIAHDWGKKNAMKKLMWKKTFHHSARFTNQNICLSFFEINKQTHAGTMQPELILPKISTDNDPSGFSRRIFFVWLMVEFKDFYYGEKNDD